MNRALAWLLLAGACLRPAIHAQEAPSIVGANVDESKVRKTYYVDQSNADAVDDADHGAEDAPFKTIGMALRTAAAEQDRGVGARVVIADGVYRETMRAPLPGPGQNGGDAPLVIEAANREQAVIDGADASGWEAGSWKPEGAQWSHPWAGPLLPAAAAEKPRRAGAEISAEPPRLLKGNALVFVGGQALRQVAEPAALGAGTFCLPEAPKAHRAHPAEPPLQAPVLIQLAEGSELAGAPIEVSARDAALVIEGRRNVVIRGITVQHAAGNSEGNPHGALELRSCSNVFIDDVLCQWNNDAGLRVTGRSSAPWSEGVTLRRVRSLYNGGAGLIASDLKNLVVEDSETSFNGFRGQWAGFIDSTGPAGSKAGGIHGGAWRRHRAVGNSARGMWWAGDCVNIVVEDCVSRANLISGLFFENSDGPFAVRRCAVTGTRLHPSVRGDVACPAGVSICAAANVQLEDNVIAGNEMPQLSVWDIAQRSDGVNFETGTRETHRAERHRYRQNVFCGFNADEPVFSFPLVDRATKAPFDFFYSSLDADADCYWNPALTEVFCSFDKGNNRRPGIDLAGWKAFLATRAGPGRVPEGASLWADPLFADPGEGDLRLRNGSPAADWGLPADEGSPGQ